MNDVAVRIGKNLDLDMPAVDDGLFQDQLARTEGALGLGARAGQRRRQFLLAATSRMPRPPPPAAAFTITGKPMRSASRASVASD